MKVYNRGEWIREIYGPKVRRKRGFIKMHVSFDIRCRKIVSLRVSDGRVGTIRCLKNLLTMLWRDVMSIGFWLIRDTIQGSPSRRKSVIEQEKYEEWRKNKGYGYRWLVESAFSSIKRTHNI